MITTNHVELTLYSRFNLEEQTRFIEPTSVSRDGVQGNRGIRQLKIVCVAVSYKNNGPANDGVVNLL